jgi:hypothetical protein
VAVALFLPRCHCREGALRIRLSACRSKQLCSAMGGKRQPGPLLKEQQPRHLLDEQRYPASPFRPPPSATRGGWQALQPRAAPDGRPASVLCFERGRRCGKEIPPRTASCLRPARGRWRPSAGRAGAGPLIITVTNLCKNLAETYNKAGSTTTATSTGRNCVRSTEDRSLCHPLGAAAMVAPTTVTIDFKSALQIRTRNSGTCKPKEPSLKEAART